MTKKTQREESRASRFVSNAEEYVIVRPKDQAPAKKTTGRIPKSGSAKGERRTS